MAITLNGKSLTVGASGGKTLSEAWLNGKNLWLSKHDTVEVVIDEICNNLNVVPIHKALFNNNIENQYVRIGQNIRYTDQFQSTSGVAFADGFERGRKALSCNSTNITLSSYARTGITTAFTFSVCVKQTAANSSNTGMLGGVIFGNGHWGLGYAVGWRPNVQGNKPSIEVYTGTGNNDGAATTVQGATVLELNKWYNIVGRCTISGGTCRIDMWVNRVWTGNSTTGNNSTIGYQSLVDQTQSSNIHLGRVQQSGWNYFKGCIQDFVLWRTAIPDAQIEKIHNYYQNQGMFGGGSGSVTPSWITPERIGIILSPSYFSGIDYTTYRISLLGLTINGSAVPLVNSLTFPTLMENVLTHTFTEGDSVSMIMLVIQTSTPFSNEMVGLLATTPSWSSDPNGVLVKLNVTNGTTLIGRTSISSAYTWNNKQGKACPLLLFLAPVDSTLGQKIANVSLAPGLTAQ